ALAGLAGATKTLVFQLASLTDVHWHKSGEVVLMTLLGGVGTVFGPIVGATKTLVFQLASLTDVHWHLSVEVVLMTLLGGVGSVFGPIVGATIVVSLQNYGA
ncbi:hypothetical protein LLG90_26685, partial [Aromatoleum toluclasticum]|nr:hypothetical protein [Aromatoleum toluclasticum]